MGAAEVRCSPNIGAARARSFGQRSAGRSLEASFARLVPPRKPFPLRPALLGQVEGPVRRRRLRASDSVSVRNPPICFTAYPRRRGHVRDRIGVIGADQRAGVLNAVVVGLLPQREVEEAR
jgi:hypothetical protein